MTFDDVRELALALGDVEEGTSYGTPALKVRGNLMIRLREDGDLVCIVGFDNRDLLMQMKPATFYSTDHYAGYPSVLVRLGKVTKAQLRDVVRMAWEHASVKKRKR